MSQNFGITEYPNTFKRQGSFPLDKSSVLNSLDEANDYAASNPTAYEGQIISVKDEGKVTAYILEISDDDNANFKLSKITSSASEDLNDAVIDINNLINSKVGIWSISKKANKPEAFLDFDILYPIEANSYEVYFNDNSVSNLLSLTDEFVTSLDNFNYDATKVKLILYGENSMIYELDAKAQYKNNVVIFGSLYLSKIHEIISE